MNEDFIRVYPGLVSPETCKETIEVFESIVGDPKYSQIVYNNAKQFENSNLGRKDLAIFLENPAFNQGSLVTKFLYYLQDCVMDYIAEFGQLKYIQLTNRAEIKVQRTMPMGGYHVWHYENGDDPSCYARELVWMIYLNDMPDGEAETEFLYQKKRIKPSQGTVLIWPAGLTHVHRGLTVYSQPKYIATGWYTKYKNDTNNT